MGIEKKVPVMVSGIGGGEGTYFPSGEVHFPQCRRPGKRQSYGDQGTNFGVL